MRRSPIPPAFPARNLTMLTILGSAHRRAGKLCDGISRRNFLTVGGFALGGLSLSSMMRAGEAAAAEGTPSLATGHQHKAIINIYLPGGPSHMDMWDLKPEAPREIRGEFSPIKTNVPGMEICELFPELAKVADKFA